MNLDVAKAGRDTNVGVVARIGSSPDGLSPGDPDPFLFEVEITVSDKELNKVVLNEVVLELRNGQQFVPVGTSPLKLIRRVEYDCSGSKAAAVIDDNATSSSLGDLRATKQNQNQKGTRKEDSTSPLQCHSGEMTTFHVHFNIPAPSYARYESQLLKKCKTFHLTFSSGGATADTITTPAAPSVATAPPARPPAAALSLPSSVEVPFNLKAIRDFYKGFTPGDLREPELNDAGQPRWVGGCGNSFDSIDGGIGVGCDYDGCDDETYDDEKYMAGFYYEVVIVGDRGPGDWINPTTEYCVEVATNTVEAISTAVELEFRALYAANTVGDDGFTTLDLVDIPRFTVIRLAVAAGTAMPRSGIISSHGLTAEILGTVPYGATLEVTVGPPAGRQGTWPVPRTPQIHLEETRELEAADVDDSAEPAAPTVAPAVLGCKGRDNDKGSITNNEDASLVAGRNDDVETVQESPTAMESILLPAAHGEKSRVAATNAINATNAAAPVATAAMFAMAHSIAAVASTPAGAAAIAATHAANPTTITPSTTAAKAAIPQTSAPAASLNVWTKHLSAEHNNAPFYRNERTKTSVWVEPEEHRLFVDQQQQQQQQKDTGKRQAPNVAWECCSNEDGQGCCGGTVADVATDDRASLSSEVTVSDGSSPASATLVRLVCAGGALEDISRVVQQLVALPQQVIDADRVIELLVAAVPQERSIIQSSVLAEVEATALAAGGESDAEVSSDAVEVSTTPLGAMAALRALLIQMRPGKREPHPRNSKCFFDVNGDAVILQRLSQPDVCEEERIATLRCLSVLLFTPQSSGSSTSTKMNTSLAAPILNTDAATVLAKMAEGERSLLGSAAMAAGILERAASL